jgi:hypothetical protein
VSSEDEFAKADADAGVKPETRESVTNVQVLPPKDSSVVSPPPSDLVKLREQLVSQYHKGAPSLVARLKAAGKEDMETLVLAMIDEVIQETDHLLGNELIATNEGSLRDASVISFKRAEVLEKAIKAVQTKQQFEKESGGIDIDSPSMIVVFRFFMTKAKETFMRMGVDTEINDLFFRHFGEVTNDWKKELRESLEAVRNTR